MSVNGMALLVAARQALPDIFVTETHPKVLYYALFKEKHDFNGPNRSVMNSRLSRLLDGVDVAPQNEHEWDAAISVFAVVRGLLGLSRDLHALPTDHDETVVQPCGRTAYVWPE